MVADGFDTFDHAYRMAARAFSQDVAVEAVVVGRLPAAPSFSTKVTITSAVEGEVVRFKIIEPTTGTVQEIEYTIPNGATTSTVATAVEALVEAITGVSSSVSSAEIAITPTVAGRRVFVYDLEHCTVEESTADAGYDDELTALEENEPNLDFYDIVIESSSTANVSKVADWAEAREKHYWVASQSSGLLAGTNSMAQDLMDLGYENTTVLYSANAHEFADAAWAAVLETSTPGFITAALKTLVGVSPAALTSTQKTNLEADNVNHYTRFRNTKVTRPGKVVSGEWIDIIRGIAALKARVQEDVFSYLTGSGKAAFTEAGLDAIASVISAACQAFVGTADQPGFLVDGSIKVRMPALSAISDADKAARRLTGVKFSADMAGAIHYVAIQGTLSNA
jgi:hypothetical protein